MLRYLYHPKVHHLLLLSWQSYQLSPTFSLLDLWLASPNLAFQNLGRVFLRISLNPSFLVKLFQKLNLAYLSKSCFLCTALADSALEQDLSLSTSLAFEDACKSVRVASWLPHLVLVLFANSSIAHSIFAPSSSLSSWRLPTIWALTLSGSPSIKDGRYSLLFLAVATADSICNSLVSSCFTPKFALPPFFFSCLFFLGWAYRLW
jgi:hypothetical protein